MLDCENKFEGIKLIMDKINEILLILDEVKIVKFKKIIFDILNNKKIHEYHYNIWVIKYNLNLMLVFK